LRGEGMMKENKYVKLNVCLLLGVIPLSVLGYTFAVYNESLFFLYEWLLLLLLLASIILSIIGIIKTKSNLQWISTSFLAFLVQFSVLSLFLGPFTEYVWFSLYYFVAFCAFIVFIVTINKVDRFKPIPIIFIIISLLFTFYMLLLNNLWGTGLS
jgi:hypothetical protein